MTIPELNPEMDVFRVGTLLEMVREMAVGLAQDGQRVKVSVQQSMGQGVFQVRAALPFSLLQSGQQTHACQPFYATKTSPKSLGSCWMDGGQGYQHGAEAPPWPQTAVATLCSPMQVVTLV